MGNGAEREMVFVEWKMEWWSRPRPGALRRRVSAYCRSDARGGRVEPSLGLARELVRSTGSKVERVRELLSGRFLLRLGASESVWDADAPNGGWGRKFPVQNAH